MAQERPLYTLYKNLKSQNYDVPDDYDRFEKALTLQGQAGASNRHKIYDSLKSQNFDVPDSYERFYSALFTPISKTSSRAKGGSVPLSDADKRMFLSNSKAIVNDAVSRLKDSKRYQELRQRQSKGKNDFGRVDLGTRKNIFGDNDNVVQDGIGGDYLTSDGGRTTNKVEAQARQRVLDEQANAYTEAVNKGDIPSVFDVRDKNGNYDLQENIGRDGTYLTEEGAKNQLDKKLAYAYERKKELEQALYDNMDRYGGLALLGDKNSNERLDERLKLTSALDQVKDEIGSLEALKSDSWYGDMGQALSNTVFRANSWDFGLSDFNLMAQMERIKTKMDNGIPLSGSEKALLQSKSGADAAAALVDEKKGWLYTWTKIAGQSLPFMLDFYLTGGYSGITKAASKGALKFAAKKGMGKVGAAILKNTGVVAADIVGSYAMAGTEQALKTGADIMQRHMGQLYQDKDGNYKFGTFDENGNLLHEGGESIGKALYKGFTAAMLENYTEKIFGHDYGIKKGLVSGLEKLGMTRTANFFRKVGNNAWYAGAKKNMKKFGIDGFFEEVMEEEINIPLNALLVGDNKMSDLLDKKQQLDIVGGMAFSVGSMYAVNAPVKGAYNRAQYYRFKNIVGKADVTARNAFGTEEDGTSKWDEVREQIDNTPNEKMGAVLHSILESRDTMSKEQIGSAIQYGIDLMKMRGYNLAKTEELNAKKTTGEQDTPEEKRQEEIENAYSEGQEADDSVKHDYQLEQNDKANVLAAKLGITPEQLHDMSDEQLESMTGQSDELDQAIYEYQDSTARYQGVLDAANDKVDLAAQQAAQQVDQMTDISRGTVRNATVKGTNGASDYGVYIISGNLATHDDGTIDIANSDKMIVYFDPTTGRKETAEPLMFSSVGEENVAEEVKEMAVTQAKEQAIKEIAGIIDGTVSVGSTFSTTDEQGNETQYEILADNGDGSAMITIDGNVDPNPHTFEELQQLKDAEDLKRLEVAKQQRAEMEAQRDGVSQTEQTSEAEETPIETEEPSILQDIDLSKVVNSDGNIVRAEVTDNRGDDMYPDAVDVFLVDDKGAFARLVVADEDGNLTTVVAKKKNVKVKDSIPLEEYRNQMAANSTAVEGESGVNAPLTEEVTDNVQPTTEEIETPKFEDGTEIPVDKDGEVDFSQTDAAHAAEWYDNNLGEDAEGTLAEYVKQAKAALTRAKEKKVKGNKPSELVASKKEKEAAIADAQAKYDSAVSIRDAYNERRISKQLDSHDGRMGLLQKAKNKFSRLKNSDEWKNDTQALWNDTIGSILHRMYDGLSVNVFDHTPQTLEEYVSSSIAPYSLNYEGTDESKGVKQETGLERKDFAKSHVLAAEGKGTTIDKFVHKLWDNRPSQFENATDQDIRNALISLITSDMNAYDMQHVIENNRIAQAEKEIEDEKMASENAPTEENAPAETTSNEQVETTAAEEETQPETPTDAEVPEDATSEKPLGEQIDENDVPFSQRQDGTTETKEERAKNIEDNRVEDMKTVDNIIGKKTRKAFERIAKMMGSKIQFQFSDKIANGWYDPETNTIYLSLASAMTDGAQFIFGHEMTHEIKNLNPSAYEELRNLVKDSYTDDAYIYFVDDMRNRYAETARSVGREDLAEKFLNEADDYFEEEFVADNIGKMIDDANYAHTLAIRMSHPLLSALHNIIQKIKRALLGTEYEDGATMMLRGIEQAYVKTMNRDAAEISTATGEQGMSYSLRKKPAPKNTIKVYKLMRLGLEDNTLNPLFIDSKSPTKLHTWYDADSPNLEQLRSLPSGVHIVNNETGETMSFEDWYNEHADLYTKDNGKVAKMGKFPSKEALQWATDNNSRFIYIEDTKNGQKRFDGENRKYWNLGINGSGSVSTFSMRPGWHAGSLPTMRQIGKGKEKNLRDDNFVWVEGEISADVDYNDEAQNNPDKDIPNRIPEDGYYLKATNANKAASQADRVGWYVAGSFKANRIMSDAECRKVIDDWNAAHPDLPVEYDYERESGKMFNADTMRLEDKDGNSSPRFSLKVYHGSGADFSEFDFSHMSEGAGSQAFGWGGYVTSSKKIGKSYAELIDSKVKISIQERKDFIKKRKKDIKDMEDYGKYSKRILKNRKANEREYLAAKKANNKVDIEFYKEIIDVIDEQLKPEYHAKLIESFRADIDKAQKDIDALKQRNVGMHNLYEVNIPDDNGNNYLDWYAPLTDEQKDKIAKQLKRLKVDVADFERRGFSLDSSFGDAYNFLTNALKHTKKWQDVNAMRATSKFLASLDFTGIKYPAGTIMGGNEEGDTNYVIFKPEDMKIVDHTKFSIRTYHGSQASFDHFDHSFMGSGEGAQAYGWGTYVTEVEGIAKAYAKQNSAKRNTEYSSAKFEYDTAKSSYNFAKGTYDFRMQDIDKLNNTLKWDKEQLVKAKESNRMNWIDEFEARVADTERALKENQDKLQDEKAEMGKAKNEMDEAKKRLDAIPEPERNLYTVEIPDDNGDNYLDWDGNTPDGLKEKVLDRLYNERREDFVDKMRKAGFNDDQINEEADYTVNKEEMADTYLKHSATGGGLYRDLSYYLGEQKKASLFLKDMGIDGVKVIAKRNTGGNKEGKMNYVIFDENNAKIVNHEKFSLKDEKAKIVADAKKNGTYLKAPNGKDSRLSSGQWTVVRTNNFKKWFGDWERDPENASKIVDENGEPMVVYHGRSTDFNTFERKEGIRFVMGLEDKVKSEGFFFSPNKEFAAEYASNASRHRGGKANIVPCFLDIRKPMDLTAENYDETYEDVTGWEYQVGMDSQSTLWDMMDEEGMADKIKAKGYDGAIFVEEVDDNYEPTQISYCALDPNQIKSADNNNGDFSSDNNDIRYSLDKDFHSRLKSAIGETDTNPSDAQKESGNYKKGHIKFGGYDFTIENPKGSERKGVDADGKQWSVKMHDTYGYIRGKIGKDGDHLDMFINDSADLDKWNGNVYVVDQVNQDGSFDEHKVMYGYNSEDEAKAAYLANYSKGWKGLGKITGVDKEAFDKWLDSSKRKTKPFADYRMFESIKPVGVGVFGNIYNQFKGKAKEAIKFLERLGGGEATAALHHHSIGDISLVWGDKKTGLAKILRKHPEVVDNLQSIIDGMEVASETDNRIKLESPTHFAVVSKEFKGEPRDKWLLTAFEKKESLANGKSMDTATTSLGGDTALSQTKESAAKIGNSSETSKENGEKFSLRDEEYLKAVEDGDMEKAQKMVNEAAEEAGYTADSDYQGTSAFNGSAPWGNGYFLTKEERKEAWDNGEFEGESTLGDYINDGIDGGNLEELTNSASYRAADNMRKKAILNVRNAIQDKANTIKMYRSVPSSVKEGSFRNGDWITPSKDYAKDNANIHGWGDDYRIIEQEVPVDDVWFDGNDIAEWGYGREEDYANDTDFAYKNTKNNKKLLDAVTYDDNGNVIPLSKRFNETDSDIRFSLKDPNKTMFGMHNISVDKLRKAIKQGGFAAPSMGVVDSKNGVYTDYGEITLIPKAEKLDKRKGNNAGTFTADAWTPTYPDVSFKATTEGNQKINRDTYDNKDMDEDMGLSMKDMWTTYLSGSGKPILMAYQFLNETGKKPKLVKYPKEYPVSVVKALKAISEKNGRRRWIDDYSDDEFATLARIYNKWRKDSGQDVPSAEEMRDIIAGIDKKISVMKDGEYKDSLSDYRDMLEKYGVTKTEVGNWIGKVMQSAKKQGKVDVGKTNNLARNKVEANSKLLAEFNKWFDGKLEEYGVSEYLYNGKTASGKPKYVPNTIENAVKIMKKQGVVGGYNDFSVNVGTFIAHLSPSANTLAAMKKSKDKLIPFGDERHGEMRSQISSEFLELGNDLKINRSDAWDDSGLYRMQELAKVKPRDLKGYISKNWKIDVSDDWADRYNKLVDVIQNNYPVFYFETKFMRPYRLYEFEKAIVPKDTPRDILDALKNAGVSIYKYNGKEDREKVTMNAVNDSDDIMFSLRGSTSYEEQLAEWKKKNHLPEQSKPLPKPVRAEGESVAEFANRMVHYVKNQNLWKTAPKPTGFTEALEKWKKENGLDGMYPPIHPNHNDFESADEYNMAVKRYRSEKEVWKDAPQPKDFDLSVDVEDMSKQMRNIRRSMLNQKDYDKRTVKSISDLVNTMLNIGWGDGLSRGKVERLLSAAKNATGANDVKKHIDNVMGILADSYLSRISKAYDNLINTNGVKADQSGVIKIGSLDVNGQNFLSEYKRAINMDEDSINERIANLEDDSAKNPDNADANGYRLSGIEAAVMFRKQIVGNDADIADVMGQIKELTDKKNPSKADKELRAALKDWILENKLNRVQMYSSLLGNVQAMISDSKTMAKEFKRKVDERKNDILHRANLDMEGEDSTYYDADSFSKRARNNSLLRAVMSPTYTFEQFLKFFGKHHANGEGYLYNYFMGEWHDAVDENQVYDEMNRENLDKKAAELFGKKFFNLVDVKFLDLVGIDGDGMKEMDCEVTDPSNKETGKRTIHLKQGQMLYIYLVNKETDGQMKLRAMGITEADVSAIEDNLDPKMKAIGEWLQDEYLPECQRRYQSTHTKYFGAPMKEVDNYFPLVINNRARNIREDVNQDMDAMSQLAGTSTGAIVTRRVNTTPLDIENADAIAVAYEHLKEMEEWSAMLPFRQDINTLLSYTHFRNQVTNQKSIAYGSGNILWNEFKQTAQIAAGTYKPKVGSLTMDSRISKALGLVSMAKISGRLWTAIKQSQSALSFITESDPQHFIWYGVNPYGSWKWAYKNLPLFRKRVERMAVGDTRIKQFMDSVEKTHNLVKTIADVGMFPNILVDSVTCAIGARSVYQTELNKLLKRGYPKEKAEEKAMLKASLSYNTTQQSSEGAFISPLQVDRTYVSAALSLFKNANYAYGRKKIEAVRGLAKTWKYWGEHKNAMVESMKRQIMDEDGLEADVAGKIANTAYKRTFCHNLGMLLNYMTIMPISWALYKVLPYIVLGDDDDKKWKMAKDSVLQGLSTTMTDDYAIPFVSSAINAGLEVGDDGKPTFNIDKLKYQNLYINPATSDLANIYSIIGNQKWWAAANKFGMLGMQALVGFNPETVGQWIEAFSEYDGSNGNTSIENKLAFLKAINAPESSIRGLYIDELGLDDEDTNKVSLAELEKRYAERQMNRDFGISKHIMSKETYDAYVEKYKQSFEKKIQEKMDKIDSYDKKKADEIFNTTSDSDIKKMIDKKRTKDASGSDEKNGDSESKKKDEKIQAAYDSFKNSFDLAADISISVKNKNLRKKFKSKIDEYGDLDESGKEIYKLDNKDFEAYKQYESSYKAYGKEIKALKEELVGADKKKAATIMSEIRQKRDEFIKEQENIN